LYWVERYYYLYRRQRYGAINAVYDAFVATCGIGSLSLSIHLPMRAGLDVGVAMQIDDKEIYGPALESAFYLESKFADKYPRFIVGKELLSYLYWVENQQCETRIGLSQRRLHGSVVK
jgi:hypothetical protein